MARRLITVNDILAGHVSLDVAWLDRIYLNGYLPTVGMALRSLGRIAGGPDQLGVAVSGTRTARGGKAVSERGGPDAGAGRKARLRDGVWGRILGRAYELLADGAFHDYEDVTRVLLP
jgi:hypothetical protein